jgi:hypothetical protein
VRTGSLLRSVSGKDEREVGGYKLIDCFLIRTTLETCAD